MDKFPVFHVAPASALCQPLWRTFWQGAALALMCASAAMAQTQTPLSLRFADFYQQPQSGQGPQMTEVLRSADGRDVRLVGYMVQMEAPIPGRFMLSPRPVQMSEHADGDADDLPPATVLVKLAPAQSTWVVPHTPGLIELAGILSVGRQEADDGRVTWVQLQLQP